MKIQQQMNLAIEEIVSNIAQYAYIDGGSVTVRVELSEDNSAVSISFIDSGIKYNPLTKDNPDITLSADEREIGGLGIYLFKKLMDAVSYEYKDGKNILRIEKKIGY
jgi:anti-sigma regulatory factor (Ser/Thr protein kinase)